MLQLHLGRSRAGARGCGGLAWLGISGHRVQKAPPPRAPHIHAICTYRGLAQPAAPRILERAQASPAANALTRPGPVCSTMLCLQGPPGQVKGQPRTPGWKQLRIGGRVPGVCTWNRRGKRGAEPRPASGPLKPAQAPSTSTHGLMGQGLQPRTSAPSPGPQPRLRALTLRRWRWSVLPAGGSPAPPALSGIESRRVRCGRSLGIPGCPTLSDH